MGRRAVAPMTILDISSLLEAVDNAGYAIIKKGDVPDWMELALTASDQAGEQLYRMRP